MTDDIEEADQPHGTPELHQVDPGQFEQRRDKQRGDEHLKTQKADLMLHLLDRIDTEVAGDALVKEPGGRDDPYDIEGPRWHLAEGTVYGTRDFHQKNFDRSMPS